jgi:hypothetical protein
MTIAEVGQTHTAKTALTLPTVRKSSTKKTAKTYNSGYSLLVTHATTNPPVHCLYMAERTGSLVFSVLWSYVEGLVNSCFIYSVSPAENTCTRLLSGWDTQDMYCPLNRVVHLCGLAVSSSTCPLLEVHSRVKGEVGKRRVRRTWLENVTQPSSMQP